jgi:uncharacterized protein (DUF2062 family)/quercetin dioxygenase-like cupin family protein
MIPPRNRDESNGTSGRPDAVILSPDRPDENPLIASLRRTYDRFVRIRGNPREIARGFALGLFVGMTPFLGLHMAIAVFIAALFKWNKIAAATGVWVSNPLTAPFLYGATFFTGARFLGMEKGAVPPPPMNWSEFLALIEQAPDFFWILTVGGVILGLPIAGAGYYLAHSAIVKYREELGRKLALERRRLALKRKNRRRAKRTRSRKPGKTARGKGLVAQKEDVMNRAEIRVTPWPNSGPVTESAIGERLAEERLSGYRWSNGPGDVYGAHSHDYHKVIYVVRGAITFGLPERNETVELSTGDRMDLPAGVVHDAVVGPEGVVCVEAHRPASG